MGKDLVRQVARRQVQRPSAANVAQEAAHDFDGVVRTGRPRRRVGWPLVADGLGSLDSPLLHAHHAPPV
jgi:hypothetical protein